MRIVLAAAAFALLASPTLAQTAPDAAPAEAPAPAKKKSAMDDPNRIVCTRDHVVGSNRPRKVCMTVAQRQALKDSADRLSNRALNDSALERGAAPGTGN